MTPVEKEELNEKPASKRNLRKKDLERKSYKKEKWQAICSLRSPLFWNWVTVGSHHRFCEQWALKDGKPTQDEKVSCEWKEVIKNLKENEKENEWIIKTIRLLLKNTVDEVGVYNIKVKQ